MSTGTAENVPVFYRQRDQRILAAYPYQHIPSVAPTMIVVMDYDQPTASWHIALIPVNWTRDFEPLATDDLRGAIPTLFRADGTLQTRELTAEMHRQRVLMEAKIGKR